MLLFWPIKLAIKLVELVVLAAIVYLVVSGVQVVEAARKTPEVVSLPRVSAIVVLAEPLVHGEVGRAERSRLAEARSLYLDGRAGRVVVGAVETAGPNAAMRWLSARGVPASRQELALGGNAASQLRAAASAVRASGATLAPVRVLVVTDAIDTLWTERAAAEDGLLATVVPPSSLPISASELGPLWRETSAVAAGRIIGFGRVTWA